MHGAVHHSLKLTSAPLHHPISLPLPHRSRGISRPQGARLPGIRPPPHREDHPDQI